MTATVRTERGWSTAPISPTCESHRDGICTARASHAYPAHGGGWAALCKEHARRFIPYCEPIDKLLAQGETLEARP